MNAKLVVYRLITFMLLPIAGINAFSLLRLISLATEHPLMLIAAFVNFAVISYTFTSFVFFTRGVQNGKIFKTSFKDWIKVNAFVSILYAGIILCGAIIFLGFVVYLTPAQLQKTIIDALNKWQPGGEAATAGGPALVSQLKASFAFAGGYSAVLLTHIIITLGLVKQHASLFSAVSNNTEA